ncbi:MAG: glycoside hydrolase family protein [Alphaproteobacteria bacterium]
MSGVVAMGMRARLIALGLSGLALAGSVAAVDGVAPFLNEVEDSRLVVYLDNLGIPTGCEGVTSGMKLGMVLTKEECDEKNAQARAEAAAVVAKATGGMDMPLSVRMALISFTYNVGPGRAGRKDGFVRLKNGRESSMLRKVKARDFRGACGQFDLWANAGGKSCKDTKGRRDGCYGVYIRRQQEKAICLRGL